MSAKIFTYSVSDGETVAELQQRIEKDTGIPAGSQELLLEAGLALEAHSPAVQCAVDYSVKPGGDDLIERSASSAGVAADGGFVFAGDRRATDRLASGLPVRSLVLQLQASAGSAHAPRKHPLCP